MKKSRAWIMVGIFAVVSFGLFITPAISHHSYAMYDMTKTITLTGVATRFIAQANHDNLDFVPLGADGKPARSKDGNYVSWRAEMGGAASMAAKGVYPSSFAPGTIFTIKMNRLRDGSNFGWIIGTIVRCPDKKLPVAGKNCDSVEGSTYYGGTAY